MVGLRRDGKELHRAHETARGADQVGKIHHNGDPVLAWMMLERGRPLRPQGQRVPGEGRASGATMIDGAIALIMALGRAMVGSGRPQNIYEVRGPVFV